MAYYHGIKTNQQPTSVSTPVVAAVGIPFVVGTAPIHTTGGKANEIILANTYSEAVEALGYSEDWEHYTLCEMIYSHFKLYSSSPVIFVNVLDPTTAKKSIASKEFSISDNKVELSINYILDGLKVSSTSGAETALIKDTDYSAFYDDDKLIVEMLSTTAKQLTKVYISGNEIDFSKVTKKEIIGGIDVSTGKATGLELIENCYAKYNIVPDLILAPGYSSDSEVAAAMQAKATGINELFEATALIDADCTTITDYRNVPEWKNSKSITKKEQIVLWPMVTLGDKKYHMSVQLAGVIAQTDSGNDDCPSDSPSNKDMQIDGLCLADGSEIVLNVTQANYLNSNGVCTAINFIGGFKAWGNETAAYPSNTDVKDYFIPISRTFAWIAKTAVLTFWSKIDSKMNRRLIDNIVDTFNIYLNGLVSEEKILGGRIEFRDDENTLTDLMSGKMKFHVFVTPPSPAKEIEFTFEYDTDYVKQALTE